MAAAEVRRHRTGRSRAARLGIAVALAAALQVLVIAPAGAGLSYVGTVHSTGAGALHSPWGVTADDVGNVYVADTSVHRIAKYNASGNFIKIFGEGSPATAGQDGHLYYPQQLVWSDGNVYVADTSGSVVQEFTEGGAFVRKWGTPGNGDGQFASPTGIGADCDGNIWVTDGLNHNVQEFSSTGAFIRRFGEANLSVPAGVAVSSYDVNGTCTTPSVFVSDEYVGRLVQFDATGAFVRNIGTFGHAHLQFDHPDQLAMYPQTTGTPIVLAVAESGTFRVQLLSSSNGGSSWTFIQQITHGAQPLSSPHGVAINKQNKLYIANTGEAEIYKYANVPPALTMHQIHNGRSHIKSNEGLLFSLKYNQLDKHCDVTVRATLDVPPHHKHVFTVRNDRIVRTSTVNLEVGLSARQLGWLKDAWHDGRSVSVVAKGTGLCSGGVTVKKTLTFTV